jgi:molybdate transport system ATP-binding protein
VNSPRLCADVVLQRGALRMAACLQTDATLVLCGPNGAGKSTLLLALLGLLDGERVHLHIDGLPMHPLPAEQRRLGYVPQGYGLLPHLDVRGNLAFARSCLPPSRRAAVDIDAALCDFGLQDLGGRAVHALSGGERQRLALARAMLARPRALLLDEPFAALDLPHRQQMRQLLAARLRQWQLPAIVISHDPADARSLADDVAVLERGRITQQGSWQQLCAAPATPFIRAWTDGTDEPVAADGR